MESIANGPITDMYRLKPLFQFTSDPIINTTMYGMKNLHESSCSKVNSDEALTSDEERKTLVKEIEVRQSAILKALAEIRSQMAMMKAELCKNNNLNSVSNVPRVKVDFSAHGINHEVVINASVHHPPYSLLAIHKLWDGAVAVKLTCHVHSSLKELPANLVNFEKLVAPSQSNSAIELRVRLVWKDGCDGCEFIVSPFKFLPLRGETNVLRFLHRCVKAGEDDPITETLLDEKLDLCHMLAFAENSKKAQALLQSLGQGLAKSNWLFSNSISIVDLAAWSAIKSMAKPNLSKQMSKWFQECEKTIGFIAQ